MSTWTTRADLRTQLEKSWQRGDLLRARLDDAPFYPLTLRLRTPNSRELGEDFAAVAEWLSALRRGSKQEMGRGYTLHWQQRLHRLHGSNELPAAVTVDSEADALALLGKQKQMDQFADLAAESLSRFPVLQGWLHGKPLRLLQYAEDWPRILNVLDAFCANPRPGCYLRELDIPGVHSKFIEQHRGFLAEVLDAALPAEAIDTSAAGARSFNRRFGLRDKPARIRFRLLDPDLAIQGLSDLEIPVGDFARLAPGADTIFITENDINGLAFPAFPSALIIFGLGYGVDTLSGIPWLADKDVHYWGDIDTHGFAILSRLRQHLPHACSLLMDRATLDAHHLLWGREDKAKRFTGDLPGLVGSEQALYRVLCENQLADCLRLEQEHIRQHWLATHLKALKMPLPHGFLDLGNTNN